MTAELDPAVVEDRLRAIQSITDAALSRLDDRELLAELLERTRDALQADTAAVLLLDFASGQLIATAAAGLEEEVNQGVRIPVGRGFAGYQQGVCFLVPGDAVLLFSDGVTEAVRPNADEEFGEEQLAQVLAGLRDQNAESIITAINQKVDDFTGGAPPLDDITLVVAKRLVN